MTMISTRLPDCVGFRPNLNVERAMKVAGAEVEYAKQQVLLSIRLWGASLLSILPWVVNARDKFQMPATVNRELKRRARSRTHPFDVQPSPPLRFRPYVCKVPWHTGVRAFLSQLFPRYGHYCGPNWSSGKDGGSLIWDRRPIDWLDYCCYCHDMGYDTHDQAKLLEADLAFLDCLEKPHMQTKGDKHVASLYKSMCIHGLRNILIPYRSHLVKVQSGQPLLGFRWLLGSWRSKRWNLQSNMKVE